MTASDFVVAPCSYEAAKYAVMNWHYSQAMPSGKLSKFGAWHEGRFIGAVIFGRGASPHLGKPYSLDQAEIAELVRVALCPGHAVATSQIVAAATRQLQRQNNGLRLVVSFADPLQGHHGGIYQAMNWLYLGRSPGKPQYFVGGRWRHERSSHHERAGAAVRFVPGKHRYVYPLDRAMRKQLAPSALPYPRGSSVEGDTSDFRSERSGSIPENRSNSELH